jgi:hypothetical protein
MMRPRTRSTLSRRIALVAVAGFMIAAIVPASVAEQHHHHPQPGWELLGERQVTDRIDHDVIPVTNAKGVFRAIQLHVLGRAVQFHAVKIHFGNGAVQEVEMREVIAAGGATRVIDVEGAERVIREVEFLYDAQSLHGHPARIRLFGRH